MYKVYLVDDEIWLLESMQAIIEWVKYDAVVVGKETSSLKAYEEIKRLNPDIVFTDIRMPDMNGIELMEKIKLWNKETVFVVISGYTDFEYARKALENNAVSYCLKPIEEEDIIDALSLAKKACDDCKVLASLYKKENNYDESNNNTYNAMVDYVKENFKKPITLQDIANHFYFNPAYLSMLFKKESGTNFTTYLNQLRINYACELLEKTDLSVNQVANLSGFANYFYFTRIFKKIKVLTPTQYRKMDCQE